MARTAGLAMGVCLTAAVVSPLGAQAPTAQVTGVVRDSARRTLEGVEIRALDLSTGFSYRTSSASNGRYWLRGLPPGTYDLSAARIGLRTSRFRAVELPVGRTIALDFTLPPSALELEPLDVRVEGATVEATRAEVAYRLDRRRIERLPEESRSFIELARLVPGATAGSAVTGAPPTFGTRGSAVGALNPQSLGVLVDGGDFTEASFGTLAGSVPLLAVREFEVVQAQYSAALGRAASGVVNVVTRRGGSELRAEAFGLYRHRALNARGAFESEKPDFDRSHWGAAAGGPLLSDRTRFFAAFERRVQHDFATVNTGGAFPGFEGTFETPLTDNLLFARIDHRAGDAHELSLRYAGEIGSQLFGVGGAVAFENGLHNGIAMHSALLGHRWTPGAGWLADARLHVLRTRRTLERNAPAGPTLVYPSLRSGPNRRHGSLTNLRIELRDALSRILTGSTGTHRLEFGVQASWQENETETLFFNDGLFLFPTDTAARPAQGIVTFEEGGIRLDARNLQLGLHVQDDWTPTPGLTLDLGLRYDIETNGSNQGFVSPFAGELPFIPTEPRPVDGDNLAPRIGIAWDPGGDGRTVLRGGFGVFYDALVAIPLLALERSSGVRTARLFRPETTDVDELGIDPDTLPPTVWTQEKGLETPMTRQYSLGFQQALPGEISLRVDGLLIQGRNLLLQRELNPRLPDGPRYPEFASVLQVLSEGRATAKMLLVEARRTFPGGWAALGYTLAERKNTNDAWGGPLVPQTDPEALALDEEWGPAGWDERHRLVATGGIELPPGLALVGKAVYASARPFTAVTGTDDNGDGQVNDRPPGEGRNARRGPDYFRTDLGLTWTGLRWGAARIGLRANAYNLFDTVNGVPSSVQTDVRSPLFGRPREAFPPRQVEIGLEVRWR